MAPDLPSELGGERLEQHRHDIGDDDPQQLVAMGRAGGDVGRKIAGVEIGDRGDERRPGERQQARERRAGRPRAAEERPGAVEDEVRTRGI